MKIKHLFVIATCACFLVACGKRSNSNNSAENTMPISAESISCSEAPPPPPPPPPSECVSQVNFIAPESAEYNPKLIKSADLRIITKDIARTKKVVRAIAAKCKGVIMREYAVSAGPDVYSEISLSVKAANFDRFMNLIDSSTLEIASRSVSISDVTMQYVDDSARLANKKQLEKSYIRLLSRAQKIGDIIEIEEKIEEVRSDIESKESQFKALKYKVAYSEVYLKIEMESNKEIKHDKGKYGTDLKNGFEKGWDDLKSFIVDVISIWPVYLLVLAIAYFVWLFVKRRRNKKAKIISKLSAK